MADTQHIGQQAEKQARDYLVKKGLQHIDSNYRCRYGEIDLIMQDKDIIVFIEVRFRKNSQFGGAAASVDVRKQHRIIATAQHFIQHQRHPANAYRFDVVAMNKNSLDWIPDAFRLD